LAKPTLTVKGRFLRCFSRINRRNLTLTVRGFTVCCANAKTTTVEQKFDWGNALIDAIITSGITFFGTLGGVAATGASGINILEAATIAAFSQFFVFLALKRGLIKSEETQQSEQK
jgi:hypothetical protein